METKLCRTCDRELPVGEFPRRGPAENHRLRSQCRACLRSRSTADRRAHPERWRKYGREARRRYAERNRSGAITPSEKRCTRCGNTLAASAFSKSSGSPDGLQSWCRGCFADYQRGRAIPNAAPATIVFDDSEITVHLTRENHGAGIEDDYSEESRP